MTLATGWAPTRSSRRSAPEGWGGVPGAGHRAASALNHPAIVTIYEIGEAAAVSYLAMELVVGETLRELLQGGGRHRAHLELVTPAGRRPLPIAPGFDEVAISPDGNEIAYQTKPQEIALCRLDEPACRRLELAAEAAPIQWSADARYL